MQEYKKLMADNRQKNRNRGTDDAGIRLAPTPIRGSNYHVLPSIRQEFVIEPRIEIEPSASHEGEGRPEISTAKDFQPKQIDKSRKWKRAQRGKNMLFGIIMLLATAVVGLPFILGAAGVKMENFPFEYIPSNFNAVKNIIDAFTFTAANGWSGEAVNAMWVQTVPSLILLVGILCLVFNVIKSLFALFGAVKPVKYAVNGTVYFCTVLAILIASLIGAPEIGIQKVDFLQEFYHAYGQSELFSLVVIAACYLVASALCTLLNRDRKGY